MSSDATEVLSLLGELVTLCVEGRVPIPVLKTFVRKCRGKKVETAPATEASSEPHSLALRRIEALERRLILDALQQTGSRERAAELLDISTTTLWRKMQRLGIK